MEKGYLISKDLISRRNQDQSIILMKLNDSSFFYKMNGLMTFIWTELETPKTISALVEHFSAQYPNHRDQLSLEISYFVEKLLRLELIAETQTPTMMSFRTIDEVLQKDFYFGEFKEFDLEMIEAEVLNENVYLDVFAGSDLRLKEKITPIQNALEKVSQLEGVQYYWDSRKAAELGQNPGKQYQAGLIAQEVAAVMPELVRSDKGTGYLGVEYSKLTSYLVEAIKELNQKVKIQECQIEELKKEMIKH